MLVAPVQAQLVIPPTAGADACTQDGLTGKNESLILNTGSITNNQVIVRTASMTATSLSRGVGYDVNLEILENKGAGQRISKSVDLGRIADATSSIAESTNSFNDLKKNTRYVAVLHNGLLGTLSVLEGQVIARRCFKTRGEFSNAEQNLQPDGSADLTKFSRTGCFAVARTRQDVTDCMCNGTRGGTRILAGQTTASQAQRQYLNCPDLDS